MEEYQVSFNSNNLHGIPGVDLYNYDFTRLPDRDIKIHKLARRSLSIITSSEYTQKNIPVWMDICSGDRQDTELTVTQVKALLQPQNGELKVLQSGETVVYTATMNEFNIEWNGPHAYCEIVFLASTPIARSIDDTQIINLTGVTSSSASQTFTIQGSYVAEPYITVVINSVTGGTGGTINLLNGSTQQGIAITEDFVNGDILTVDSVEYEVLLNGVKIDFEGIFPTFPPGSQQFSYVDTFSTRNVDIAGTYHKRLV